MSLRCFFSITLLVFFATKAFPADGQRPNVIFIITDDQRLHDFGFISGKALTPNIDKIANDGVFFKNSYTCSTVCTPSRYACITGRYPSRSTSPAFLRDITPEGETQVYFNTHIEADRPNLPSVMKAAGYTTGMVGKWHIGSHVGEKHKLPRNSNPKDPLVKEVLQKAQQALCDDYKQYGFDYVSRVYAGNILDGGLLEHAGVATHNMDWVTEGALDFIDANHKKPFFLYFATTLAHSPNTLESMETDPCVTPVGFLDAAPQGMPSREAIFEKVKNAGFPRETAPATWLDSGVGAIMRKLETLGIAENTLIIYFNDHGMEHSSKSSLYQGALRTPSMAYWPGQIKPQVCDELVSNIDITPTIFDACEVTAPAGMVLDGMSYLPLLTGKEVDWRDAVYGEIGFTRAIITKDWKYLAFRLPASQQPDPEEGMRQQIAMLEDIRTKQKWVKWEADPMAKVSHIGGPPGGNFLVRLTMLAKPPYLPNYFDVDQLYDLGNDPLETTNLAGNPEYAAKLANMREKLREKLKTLPGTFGDLKISKSEK